MYFSMKFLPRIRTGDWTQTLYHASQAHNSWVVVDCVTRNTCRWQELIFFRYGVYKHFCISGNGRFTTPENGPLASIPPSTGMTEWINLGQISEERGNNAFPSQGKKQHIHLYFKTHHFVVGAGDSVSILKFRMGTWELIRWQSAW